MDENEKMVSVTDDKQSQDAASLGVPIPKKLIDVLEQIKAKSDDDNDSN